MEIAHKEWLTVMHDGAPFLGYSQEWYETKHQRRAGCGPTVASMMIAYIEKKERNKEIKTDKEALALMNCVWGYVTPRTGGLYRTKWMKEGIGAYFKDHALSFTAENLPVTWRKKHRPACDEARDFIFEGLSEDAPVGFLSLHRGGEPLPYSWHWMPLVALDETTATVWDEGGIFHFSLEKWLQHSRFGGGFVRIIKG